MILEIRGWLNSLNQGLSYKKIVNKEKIIIAITPSLQVNYLGGSYIKDNPQSEKKRLTL